MRLSRSIRRLALLPMLAAASFFFGAGSVLMSTCGPFTDVSDPAFCPFVLEIFTLGITTGTTPATYSPGDTVTRLQMAAFLSRTVDGVLRRGSRRAAMDQFWTPQNAGALGLTSVGNGPALLKSDGADLWVANNLDGTVSRVRGNDGRLLETWTGATNANGVLVAIGRVFVAGLVSPGRLYQIDPRQAAGAVTTVASNLGTVPAGIAFDGSKLWTANSFGSVSIVTPGATIPWTVTTVTSGFTQLTGALYDGQNIWVTDTTSGFLLKLDSGGAILQTVTVGSSPGYPVFDGANIWVPRYTNALAVVRASTGAILATLTGNGMNVPQVAAFDGQRVLVTNEADSNFSLWKAADLTPIGSFSTGTSTGPYGVCSDGVNFWIALFAADQIARF